MMKVSELAEKTANEICLEYGSRLTMPVMSWSTEVIGKIALAYKNYARKGSYKVYAKEIVKYFPETFKELFEEYISNTCMKYELYR